MCFQKFRRGKRSLLTERRESGSTRGLRWCAVPGAITVLAASLGLAQHRSMPGPRAPRMPRQARTSPRPKPGMANRRDQHPHQPGFFPLLRELPPAEQERVMANDGRFQRLPPERQAMIRERLRQWNQLPPEQKELIRQRQEILQSLSPAQQQELRTIFPHYRFLTTDRRQEVMQAFRRLRDMPPAERESFLSSPEVREKFNPQERELLERLNRILAPEPNNIPPQTEEEP